MQNFQVLLGLKSVPDEREGHVVAKPMASNCYIT